MTTIPTTIPVPPEPAIPNFSFIEFITNKGVKIFQAGDTVSEQILSTDTFYSENSSTATDEDNDTDTVEFTAKFERTVVIEGTAIVNVPTRLLNQDPDSSDITCVYTMKIIKRVNSTDTDLLNKDQTVVKTGVTSASTNQFTTLSVSGTISKTILKAGDSLVFQIVGNLSHTNPGQVPNTAIKWQIFHDPKDRAVNANADTNQTTIHIPFRIV